MAEKTDEKQSLSIHSEVIVLLALISILIGIIIAIPIVYSKGKNQVVETRSFNVSSSLTDNECTNSDRTKKFAVLEYLENVEPFPYKYHQYLYRPTVVSKKINLIFGFHHDQRSWSIDAIKVIDTTSNTDVIQDGDFESNYLLKSYSKCILSNTRSSTSDILFDIPYSNDFYYNDQTLVGMSYLYQQLTITGGRYYNITFYLENRGFPTNSFLLMIAY